MQQFVPSFFGGLKDTGSPTFEKKHFHFHFMLFSKGNEVKLRSEVAIEFGYPSRNNKSSNLRNTEYCFRQ